jgi:hypothetical protein
LEFIYAEPLSKNVLWTLYWMVNECKQLRKHYLQTEKHYDVIIETKLMSGENMIIHREVVGSAIRINAEYSH